MQGTMNARFARGIHICNMLSNTEVAYNIKIQKTCKAAAMHIYQKKGCVNSLVVTTYLHKNSALK